MAAQAASETRNKGPARAAHDRAVPPETIQAFCRLVLESGTLEAKLQTPKLPGGEPLIDTPSGQPMPLDRPHRGAGLRMGRGSDRLPKPGQLKQKDQRILCLARFAHHELQAVEYFAWAILRWPEVPPELRRAWLSALADEQLHCRLYLDRLAAHGGRFDGDDHSDYFWQQAPAIAASSAGPRAFLAAMGLTLEQANLDFTLTYRDGFVEAGDPESAAVCQRVHDDEIAHVALAAKWLMRLRADDRASGSDDLSEYLECVPFPLGPARAKGRRFEVGPRRKAGLSDRLIETIRVARSTAELAAPGRVAPSSPRDDKAEAPRTSRTACEADSE